MKFGLTTYIRDSDQAFEEAIDSGQMTEGHLDDWMYMYSDDESDHFKHILTRKYWAVTRPKAETEEPQK